MCTNPISLRTGILVGCGHCQQCLKQYQDQWIARLNSELKQWSFTQIDSRSNASIYSNHRPVIFFTLKYADSKVPHSYFNIHSTGLSVTDYVPVCKDLFVPVEKFHTDLKELNSGAWDVRKKKLLSIVSEYRNAYENEEGGSTWSLACPAGPCVHSFEFNTVRKKDVQDWLKRGRISLQRKYPDIFNVGQNPRQKRTWIDFSGISHDYPSCSLTPTVKYFISSEYGPRTFRPHLHGCMFGVTYEEFRDCFANDWQKNFGSIDFQVLDSSRGGISYIAKYCSKGMYEHPYCSKDFFYHSSGLEFHSDQYEYCLRDFGVDAPLVSKTFHLISKGLGVSYCFDAEIQNFFGARLEPIHSESGKLSYIVKDSSSSLSDYVPVTGLFDERYKPSESLEILPEPNYSGVILRRYQLSRDSSGLRVKSLIGESFLSNQAIIDCSLEQRLLSKKYSRTYVTKTKNTPTVHGAWHLVGHHLAPAKVSTTEITLPRYYRRWLLSPLAQSLRASAAYLLHPSLDEQESRIIQQQGLSDLALSSIESLRSGEKIRRQDLTKKLRKSTERFLYNRPVIEGIS